MKVITQEATKTKKIVVFIIWSQRHVSFIVTMVSQARSHHLG